MTTMMQNMIISNTALLLLLNGCVTSQWDRQHQCQQTCDGKCSQSCAVVVEQGATEVKLPGH
jgi:protein involved in sex pheromone biosynthesis